MEFKPPNNSNGCVLSLHLIFQFCGRFPENTLSFVRIEIVLCFLRNTLGSRGLFFPFTRKIAAKAAPPKCRRVFRQSSCFVCVISDFRDKNQLKLRFELFNHSCCWFCKTNQRRGSIPEPISHMEMRFPVRVTRGPSQGASKCRVFIY